MNTIFLILLVITASSASSAATYNGPEYQINILGVINGKPIITEVKHVPVSKNNTSQNMQLANKAVHHE